MRLPRRQVPALVLTAAVAAAAVVSLAWGSGTRRTTPVGPLADEWLLPCYDQRASSYDPVPSKPVDRPSELRLAGVLLPRPSADDLRGVLFQAADMPGASGRAVLSIENAGTPPRDKARTVEWSSLQDSEPEVICDGRLLSAFRTGSGRDLRFLCGNPALEYRSVQRGSGLVPSDLFVLNYSRETELPQPQCFQMALHAAARIESLHIDNVLETRRADGALATRTLLDPSYNPTSAEVVRLGERDVALVIFDSGYQVSEALYRELTLPTIDSHSRGFQAPRAATRSYGSFRGLLAIDMESGDLLWERRLGVIPIQHMACADLSGDGVEEVVLAVYSPDNGVSARGTTDRGCAYLLCLDADGNELWRHRICGAFVGVVTSVGDVTGDGAPEVVAVCASAKNPDSGLVTVLDGAGEVLSESTEAGSAGGLVLADLTGDGADEILTSDTRGRLIVFDGGLHVVDECSSDLHAAYDRKRLLPVVANDIDGDGTTEVVVLSTAWTLHVWNAMIADGWLDNDTLSYVMVLDDELREEARARVPGPGGWGRAPGGVGCMIVDIDGNGTNEAVMTLESVGANVFELVPGRAAPQ